MKKPKFVKKLQKLNYKDVTVYLSGGSILATLKGNSYFDKDSVRLDLPNGSVIIFGLFTVVDVRVGDREIQVIV